MLRLEAEVVTALLSDQPTTVVEQLWVGGCGKLFIADVPFCQLVIVNHGAPGATPHIHGRDARWKWGMWWEPKGAYANMAL